MLIPIILILQSLVELLAIVAVVFRVIGLLLGLRLCCLYLRRLLHEDLLNPSSICLYLLLDHFHYLGLHVLDLGVEILISYLLADLGHQVDSSHPNIAILILKISLACIQ